MDDLKSVQRLYDKNFLRFITFLAKTEHQKRALIKPHLTNLQGRYIAY